MPVASRRSAEPRPQRRLLAVAALLVIFAAAAGNASPLQEAAPEPATDAAEDALAPRYREWLASVAGLISEAEREYFLGLTQDYQRDAFMEVFWQPRDPEPRTARNELRDRWQQAIADGTGVPTGDPRFLLYLLNGPPGNYSLPDGRPVARCFSTSWELEIWFYGGSERTARRFAVIFYRPSASVPFRVYRLGDAIRPTRRVGRLPTTEVRALCADELLRFAVGEIARSSGYDDLLREVLTPPTPSAEWLASLALSATELPPGAARLGLAVAVDYPARRQSRTAVRVVLQVPADQAPGRRFDGQLFHNFELNGEVIRDGRRFESFSYRFEGPTPEGAEVLPLGFTRYLRPGALTLRLLLHDVFSDRYAQVVRELEIPSPAGLPEDPGQSLLAALVDGPAATEDGAPSLRLAAPPAAPLAGPVRFTARSQGPLDKVTFLLDERPVFTLRRPPWSAELNLGPTPAPHRVRVVGFVGDREVASDQIWVNQGAARFRVRLVEPREGGIYPGSLTARVEVETPSGEQPERIELWLDGELVATLREPPLARTLDLRGARPAVVRAVAYLADGSAAEDAVLVNAAGLTETVEVRLVEIPVRVVDDRGESLVDLAAADFRLYDGDRRLTIQRVVPPGEFPLQAALLIDRSASMAPILGQVAEAAVGFVRTAAESPGDRLAVLSFAGRMRVDAGFSDRVADLERALAGLAAGGGTALYDSLAHAAASFEEAPGQRALVLFSDGADENSAIDLAGAIAAAQRHRVSVFAIGLAESFAERGARRELERLTEQTGGGTWLLAEPGELAVVYQSILASLRARYLLVYRPPGDAEAERRDLRVEVERAGARVETQSGYYP